jgi:hypothetical protein
MITRRSCVRIARVTHENRWDEITHITLELFYTPNFDLRKRFALVPCEASSIVRDMV